MAAAPERALACTATGQIRTCGKTIANDEDVADDGAGRRGDEADDDAGRELALRPEAKSFGGETLLRSSSSFEQRAIRRAHRLEDELVLSGRGTS